MWCNLETMQANDVTYPLGLPLWEKKEKIVHRLQPTINN